MKKLLLALSLITLPSLASAELAIQDGYSIQGKMQIALPKIGDIKAKFDEHQGKNVYMSG